jgi:hypothetical protein
MTESGKRRPRIDGRQRGSERGMQPGQEVPVISRAEGFCAPLFQRG